MTREYLEDLFEAGQKAVADEKNPLKTYFVGLMVGVIARLEGEITGQKVVIHMLSDRLSRVESKVFAELLGGEE